MAAADAGEGGDGVSVAVTVTGKKRKRSLYSLPGAFSKDFRRHLSRNPSVTLMLWLGEVLHMQMQKHVTALFPFISSINFPCKSFPSKKNVFFLNPTGEEVL